MLPIDVLYLSHIKYQPNCVSSMGDRWGALLEAPTQRYTILSSYIKLFFTNHSSVCGYGPLV